MSLLEKQVRDNLVQIFASPHRKAYMHLTSKCGAHKLDPTHFTTELNTNEASFDVIYTSSGKIETRCNIELDENRYRNFVYIKIGYKRKAFRLATLNNPNGVKNAQGWVENIVKKDLLKDIGFQKAFFTKVVDSMEYHIRDDVENAAEKIKAGQEKHDVVLQFPDWNVESMYGHGWRIEHKTLQIKIELTKELDIEKIMIPSNKFMCYPDDEFMSKLLALFEERAEPASESDNE